LQRTFLPAAAQAAARTQVEPLYSYREDDWCCEATPFISAKHAKGVWRTALKTAKRSLGQ